MLSWLRRSRYLPIQCFRSTVVLVWRKSASRPGFQSLPSSILPSAWVCSCGYGPSLIRTDRPGMPRCAISLSTSYRPCEPDLAWLRPSRSHFFIRRAPMKGLIMSTTLSTNVTIPETGFLRQPQVLTFVPISKSTLWRRVGAGTFPAPVKLSPRVTVWRAEDVRRWIAEQGTQT